MKNTLHETNQSPDGRRYAKWTLRRGP
jgi:hypothetical protein